MTEKLERIVQARMQLRRRFEEKIRSTPSMTDDQPLGTGPTNRHGMPELPIGQTLTRKWPVLDLGVLPSITRDEWELVVDGECEEPVRMSFGDLLALEQVDDSSDFHCVTTWSRLDLAWRGVRLSEIAAHARVKGSASAVMCHGYDGYTTNVTLEEALKPDVLLAYQVDGEPLPREHGGPVRMITPQLYAWKGAKWIRRLEFMNDNRPGFWEQRGYSNTAYPWRNDRYG